MPPDISKPEFDYTESERGDYTPSSPLPVTTEEADLVFGSECSSTLPQAGPEKPRLQPRAEGVLEAPPGKHSEGRAGPRGMATLGDDVGSVPLRASWLLGAQSLEGLRKARSHTAMELMWARQAVQSRLQVGDLTFGSSF